MRHPGPLRAALSLAAAACLLSAPLAGCGSSDPVAVVRELHAQGRYLESLEPLRELVEARSDDPEVNYLYGLALTQTQQAGLAPFALRKAMESGEWLVPAGLVLATVELETANPEAAVEVATRVLDAEPDHVAALALRARAQATSRRHFDRALADAERILELDPDNLEGLMLRAVALLGLERTEEAEAVIAQLESMAREAEFDPALTDRYCAMRAVFYSEKGDAPEAERLFGACLEAAPASAEVVWEAIRFSDAQGRPERAIEILRAALGEQPTGTFRRPLAERLRQAGDPAAAEAVLREGTELDNPGLVIEAWVDLANHFDTLEDQAQAASALGHAVELSGGRDRDLLFYYADALVMAGRFDEALAIAKDLEFPVYRSIIEGRAALEQGRPEEALERFDEALPQWPDNAFLRYYAALAAERTARFDRAIAEYRYSIRAGKAETDARLRLARLHAAAGEPDAALAVVRHDLGGQGPGGLEAELLGVRLLARHGRMKEANELVAAIAASHGAVGVAVAAMAEGVREAAGPDEAASIIRGALGLDLADPANALVLRALVGFLGEAGRASDALAAADAAVARHPDEADFHQIRGTALAASGAPTRELRSAYESALAIDPRSARSLCALAKLSAEDSDPAAALALYARSAEADPDSPAALLASAELLVGLGRAGEAEGQLAEALERDPYDGSAARRLLELRLERGDPDLDRALALGRQAVRFGGGPAAYALLAQVFERRGEHDLARKAEAQAQAPVPSAGPASSG
jgi:tetratricopeptide (TPR) repeat protein